MEGTLNRAALFLLLSCSALAACGGAAPPSATEAAPTSDALAWAEVLESEPDPAVITDPTWRARILATGLPWRVRDRVSGIELLLVPPSAGQRGASDDDPEAAVDERPAHTVTAIEPYYLGRYEVTQAEWAKVLGDTPSFFDDSAEAALRPVENVALFRVHAFLAATGLELPTESQWELACRADDPRPRHGELDDVAWHRGNSGGRPQTCGTRAANALGFSDLLGNVWEWTKSGYMADEYERTAGRELDVRTHVATAPKAVLRGGSWYDPPKRARASARYAVERDFVGGHVGFRVARAVSRP